MKKAIVVLFVAMVITAGSVVGGYLATLQRETEDSKVAAIQQAAAKATEPAKTVSVVVPSMIENSEGQYVNLTGPTPEFDVKEQALIGFGKAVNLKLAYGGKLTETVKLNETEELVVRERYITRPGAGYADIKACNAGAVYLDGALVFRPRFPNWLDPREITSPDWVPPTPVKTFQSLAEVKDYAVANRYWMVIGGCETAALLGWSNPDWEVFKLKVGEDNLTVFGVKIAKSEQDWPTGTVAGTHIHFRYLGIGWGGWDTGKGPGIVSVFGFPNLSSDDRTPLKVDDLKTAMLKEGNKVVYDDDTEGEIDLAKLR